MRRICVFCGSSPGSRPEYGAAAGEMGTELVRRNIGLVYGGGNVGLMGIIADAVLRAGGEAQGVIPEHLMAREVGHRGLTKLHLVRSMRERKALMADLSDAFVALPGGFGTLEEFCEVVTWTQLGLHGAVCSCGKWSNTGSQRTRTHRWESACPEIVGGSPDTRHGKCVVLERNCANTEQ